MVRYIKCRKHLKWNKRMRIWYCKWFFFSEREILRTKKQDLMIIEPMTHGLDSLLLLYCMSWRLHVTACRTPVEPFILTPCCTLSQSNEMRDDHRFPRWLLSSCCRHEEIISATILSSLLTHYRAKKQGTCACSPDGRQQNETFLMIKKKAQLTETLCWNANFLGLNNDTSDWSIPL